MSMLDETLTLTRRWLPYGIAAAVTASPLALLASAVALPNTFVNGTVADADAVNANFAAIEAAVDDNDARITALSSSTQFAQITSCRRDAVIPQNNGNTCYYDWVAADCSAGVPQGTCLGMMRVARHSGDDEDWVVKLPGEVGPFTPASATGGMEWWNDNGCGNDSNNLGAVYFCNP
jgi:hypothetical protein